MRRLRKRTIVALLLTGSLSYCGYNFISAGPRVQALCRQIAPGTTVEALRPFAAAHGLAPIPSDPRQNGTTYIVETRSFGRHGCELQWRDGQIATVRDHFAD